MLRHRWEYRVPGTPEELWPYAGDTERFNRLVGNPAVSYQEIPDPQGGSRRYASFRLHGIPAAWREFPYEWRENEGWSIRRVYTKGPLSEFVLQLWLIPDGEHTRLVFEAKLKAANRLLAPFLPLVMHEIRKKSDVFAERVKGWRAGRYDRIFTESHPPMSAPSRARLDAMSAELAHLDFARPLVERLVQFLVASPDFDLLKIRPYAVADAWGEERKTVLRLFLHAARLGLCDMSWDLICPECRGAKEQHASLSLLAPTVHCDSCNIDFRANFDSSVELTFRPSPAVRKVEALLYCVGGPGNTPHVVFQRLLEPGAEDALTLPKTPGAYRLRSPQLPGQVTVNVAPEGVSSETLALSSEAALPGDLDASPGAVLTLRNPDEAPKLVLLERMAWADDVVRASAVTAMQEFRDLFGAQNLAPGVELGISRLAFLFSDLKASTAMYAVMGDAPAFSLVQEHFRILEREVATHGGAVVKTIGDAIMAVFADPGDCVRAGLAIQQAINLFNTASKAPPLTVKLGAHLGPTIAVNMNDRLDYFGTTVNVAARVQNESDGGDLVLTAELLADPGVQEALRDWTLEREAFEVRLKGLERPFALTRFRFEARPDTGRLLEKVIEASGLRVGDSQLAAGQVQQERAQ